MVCPLTYQLKVQVSVSKAPLNIGDLKQRRLKLFGQVEDHNHALQASLKQHGKWR